MLNTGETPMLNEDLFNEGDAVLIEAARGIAKHTATQPKGYRDIQSHRITNTAGHTVVAKTSTYGGDTPHEVNQVDSLHTKAGKEIPGEHGGIASVQKKHGEGKYARHFKEEYAINENYNLSPIADTITLVANGQAGEATPIVHDLLGARVLDALQSHKQEIAQTLFAPSADSLTEETEQLDEKIDYKKNEATLKSFVPKWEAADKAAKKKK